MDLGINNKTALVLAGGGGLGGAIARYLAHEGVRVFVADGDSSAAQTVAAEITGDGGHAQALSWDLRDHEAGISQIQSIEETGISIDILVNITGGPPPSPVSGQPAAAWLEQFESMVLSIITLTDSVLDRMKQNRWGRIITSVSSGVVTPIPNLGLSNALRSQLLGWSKTLANEVGEFGITSNVIIPGRIYTPRIAFLDEAKAAREGKDIEDVQSASWEQIPLGRYGRPDEYAAAVAFLASDVAGYITGSSIRVDGGLIKSV